MLLLHIWGLPLGPLLGKCGEVGEFLSLDDSRATSLEVGVPNCKVWKGGILRHNLHCIG